jgi:hypothetical protein
MEAARSFPMSASIPTKPCDVTFQKKAIFAVFIVRSHISHKEFKPLHLIYKDTAYFSSAHFNSVADRPIDFLTRNSHSDAFDNHVTVHRSGFTFNNQTDALIIQIYFVIKLYMFRAPSLPIIRSSLLHIQHWYFSSRF